MARRPLTRQRILKAALRIADRDGLDAISMRRIGVEVGAEAMSLYHHVANKAAIFDGLQALLLSESKLPTGDVGWEEWVRGFTDAFRRLSQRHPRCVPLFASRGISTPDALAPFEAGLAAFRRTGLTPKAAYHSLQTVTAVAVGLGLVEAAATTNPLEAGIDPEAGALERFPHVTEALLAVGQFDADALWRFVVDTLVAGIASQLPGSSESDH